MTQDPFTRKYGRYSGEKLETALTGEFANIYKNGQPKRHKILDYDPLPDALEDGDIVLTIVAGTAKIVVRIKGALYHATLTAGA